MSARTSPARLSRVRSELEELQSEERRALHELREIQVKCRNKLLELAFLETVAEMQEQREHMRAQIAARGRSLSPEKSRRKGDTSKATTECGAVCPVHLELDVRGGTQEDSVEVNRSALERGPFAVSR